MALTATQKANVRLFLGWSARFHQIDTRVEAAMNALPEQPEHEAQVIALLAELADIDTNIKGAYPRLQASSVGSIALNPSEMSMLKSEGRRFVGRIASILGVPIKKDVFSGGGSSCNYVGK